MTVLLYMFRHSESRKWTSPAEKTMGGGDGKTRSPRAMDSYESVPKLVVQ